MTAAPLPGVDAVLLDIGGTLIEEAPPGTPVAALEPRPLPGVRDAVAALAAHHRLAAVTDTAVMREAEVRAHLDACGLGRYLDVVVTSTDAGAPKPDPVGVAEACRRLGVAPARALLIGDRDADREAATRANVAFRATDRGLADALDRERLLAAGPFGAARRRVRPLDAAAVDAATARQQQLTKPVGSLGELEAVAARLCGIAGRCPPPVPASPHVAVFAADHGVARTGVTPWPQEITARMVENMVRGGAAINAIARQVGAAVHVVDVGVATAYDGHGGVIDRRVRAGTDDLSRGPAMTSAQAIAALDAGAEVAAELVGRGADCLVTGEMGIGNTTPSAAVVAVLTGRPAASVTGIGTGVQGEALEMKRAVVAAAAARASSFLDPVSVLSEVGGLEIAALAGFITGGAAAGVPVVVDGVIACAALAVAAAITPAVAPRCLAGHRSSEPAATVVLDHLGLVPLLDLRMRLGEGTGACLAVPIVQSAARALVEMATLADLGVGEQER